MNFKLYLESVMNFRQTIINLITALSTKNETDINILADYLEGDPLGHFLNLKFNKLDTTEAKNTLLKDPRLVGTTITCESICNYFYLIEDNVDLPLNGWMYSKKFHSFRFWIAAYAEDMNRFEFEYIIAEKNLISGNPQTIKPNKFAKLHNLASQLYYNTGSPFEDKITLIVPSTNILYHLAIVLATI